MTYMSNRPVELPFVNLDILTLEVDIWRGSMPAVLGLTMLPSFNFRFKDPIFIQFRRDMTASNLNDIFSADIRIVFHLACHCNSLT